jgi:hypothetical protein
MLARFERLMEQAVESSVRRVFPTSIQPVQLAKAAARAMENAQVVGLYGAEVPNAYRLRLAPEDLARFSEYSATLSRELSRYLVNYAGDRNLRPVGEPRVELVEDASVRAGSVRAEARFVDVEPDHQTALDRAIEDTRNLRLAALRDAPASRAAPPRTDGALLLSDAAGLRFQLEPEAGVVRIGRASDNDVTIDHARISRYHAHLRCVEATWLVYDLDSTNGTYVDGERVTGERPRPLKAGSTLRLGDYDLRVAWTSA